MNPANVPPWGCSWHGLVQGGILALPNGGIMAYPQPAGVYAQPNNTPVPDRFGETHRVAVPGTPAVTRSAEEAAADAAAGIDWRNEAVLGGANQMLHGHNLGGWIYVDPAGDRWLVRCSALNENIEYTIGALALTVTLQRFGDLGVAPEQHSYPLTLTDWGTGYGYAPTKARLLVDAIRSDGAAAVVMVHERRVNAQQIRWPHAFLELTLSGPGSAAVVALGVARTREQVLTVERSGPLGEYHLAGWRRFYETGGGYSEFVTVPYVAGDTVDGGNTYLLDYTRLDENGYFLKEKWHTKICYVVAGQFVLNSRRILALWYDETGALIEVVVDCALQTTETRPMPADGYRDCSLSTNWAVALEVGGAQMSVVSGSETHTTHELYANLVYLGTGETWPYPSEWLSVSDWTFDGSSQHSESTNDPAWSNWLEPGSFSGSSGMEFQRLLRTTYAGDVLEGSTIEQLTEQTFEYGIAPRAHVAFMRYANHVIGMRASRPPGVYAYHPPVTPSGAAPGAPFVGSSTTNRYGSWCPFTHNTQWRVAAPVCYV